MFNLYVDETARNWYDKAQSGQQNPSVHAQPRD